MLYLGCRLLAEKTVMMLIFDCLVGGISLDAPCTGPGAAPVTAVQGTQPQVAQGSLSPPGETQKPPLCSLR